MLRLLLVTPLVVVLGCTEPLEEADPVFAAAPAAAITAAQVTDWNAAHSWGDHRAAGYLSTETAEIDPQVGPLSPGQYCVGSASGNEIQCNLPPPTRCDTAGVDCGAIRVERVVYTAPRSHQLVLGDADFRVRSSASEMSCCSGSGGASITNGTTDGLVAPIPLPVGAAITRVTFHFVDTDAAVNLRFSLQTQGLAGNYATTGSILSSGAPGTSSLVLDLDPAYTLSASRAAQLLAIPNDGSIAAWPSSGTTLKIRGALIDYQLSEAP